MRTAAYKVDVASDRRRRQNVQGTFFLVYQENYQTGTSFTSDTEIQKFYIRVTDANEFALAEVTDMPGAFFNSLHIVKI